MNKRVYIFLTSLILSVFALNSLTIGEIRNSDEYLSGFGKANTYEKADQKALKDLVSSI